jgi:peptidoglycan/xylan/chitin deacetylase (PgdA/CDA1 family)
MTRALSQHGTLVTPGDQSFFMAAGGTAPNLSLSSRRPDRTMVATFQSGHGWGTAGTAGAGQTANDTTTSAIGSQSFKVVTNGAGSADNIYKWNGASVDWTNKYPAVLLKVQGIDHLKSFQVQLGGGGSMQNNNTFGVMNLASNDKFLGDNQWYWITIPWEPSLTGGTGAPRSAITDLQMNFTDDNTGNPVTINVQALAAVSIPSPWTTGCVSFDLDDGFISHYNIARPILAKYDFKANLYPVTESIDTTSSYMTSANLQELQNVHGWNIGCHSDTWVHHNAPYNLTGPAAQTMMQQNRSWLASRGLRGGDFFAYPGGADTATTLAAAQQYFVAARTTTQRTKETLPAGNPHRLRILLMDSTKTVPGIQAAIDSAYAGNFHLILVTHDIVASGATAGTILTSTFQGIVDYVATKGIPVKTMAEVNTAR